MITKPLEEIIHYYRNKVLPLSVNIEIIQTCNFNCIHCLRNNKTFKNYLEFEKIKEVINELYKLGTFYITLTGGEPLLHPELEKILDLLINKGFKYSLFTNGYLLDKLPQKYLNNNFIKELHISMHSITEPLWNKITNSENSMSKVLRNILNITDKEKVIVKTNIMKINYNDLENIIKWCKHNNLRHQYSYLLFPKNDGSKDILKYRLTNEQLLAAKNKGFISNIIHDNKSVLCNMGRTIASIDCKGNVYPCITLRHSAGNIYEKNLTGIWKESEFLKYIRNLKSNDFKECVNCEYIKNCVKCPGLAYQEHNNLLTNPKELCRIIKKFKN